MTVLEWITGADYSSGIFSALNYTISHLPPTRKVVIDTLGHLLLRLYQTWYQTTSKIQCTYGLELIH